MHSYTVTSGYLIEKTFGRMCREHLAGLDYYRPHLGELQGYSWPCKDVPPERMAKQYRGLARDPMDDWDEKLRGMGCVEPTDEELVASLFLGELEKAGRLEDGFAASAEDAEEGLRRILPPVEREIIWVRRTDARQRTAWRRAVGL